MMEEFQIACPVSGETPAGRVCKLLSNSCQLGILGVAEVHELGNIFCHMSVNRKPWHSSIWSSPMNLLFYRIWCQEYFEMPIMAFSFIWKTSIKKPNHKNQDWRFRSFLLFYFYFTKGCTIVAHFPHPRNLRLFIRGWQPHRKKGWLTFSLIVGIYWF